MRTLFRLAPIVTLAAVLPAQPNLRPGTNVKLSTLGSIGVPGPMVGTQQPWGVSTTSCNIGTVNVPWLQDMNVDHPQMGMWMYREYQGRFEQISIFRGVKHGFTSTNSPGSNCASGCPGGAGTSLVINCTDTYGASLNYSHSYMAPPSEINPWTGVWTSRGSHFDRGFPVQSPPFDTDNVRSPINFASSDLGYRNVVLDSALQAPGAVFWCTGYYNVAGEPDANRENNFATRTFTATKSGSTWSFAISGTQVETPAIYRWTGATVSSALNGAGDDGRFYVAVRVTGPVSGRYHYEYVVFNRDNNRQGGAVHIPVCSTAAVTSLSFRDVDEVATNQWSIVRNASEIVFTAPAGNVNNLTWGNMYNFAFDCDAAPSAGNLNVDEALAGPGNPSVAVATSCPLNMRNIPLGAGCGTPTPPVLSANLPASLGNPLFALTTSNVAPGSSNVYLLSLATANISLGGGCTAWIDPGQLALVAAVAANGAGVATLGLPIPNDPSLNDAYMAAQSLELEAGGAYAGLIDLSSGLKVKFGSGNVGCN